MAVTGHSIPLPAFLSYPWKDFDRGSTITVATGEPICDESNYGLDYCFYLLPVCPVIVHPRRADVFEVVPAGFVKCD